ncbi:MAG: diguanylate cyclase [Planctomycetota bacterium]
MGNRVLIVDDDPASRRLIHKYLQDSGMEVMEAANGREAMRIVLDEAPPIIVTDWEMPEMSGIELCRALRTHEGVRFAYIIIVTAESDTERLVEAFEAGADDFLPKPVNHHELVARLRAGQRIARLESDLARHAREIHQLNAESAVVNKKLENANSRLLKIATIDYLTGLPNRREAMNRLRECWATWERYQSLLSCIMIDIDHFKNFNDEYGHAAGDQILAETAGVLARSVRVNDIVCRIGGEEFLVICPHTDMDGAAACAEKLRSAVESAQFVHEARPLHVTISLGLAEAGDYMKTPEEFLKIVDKAMYDSKNSGRNCVTRAPSLMRPVG